jgi:hypothetical protein
MRPADTVLAALEPLPGIELEIDDARRSARVRVNTALVARIDLGRGCVLVSAPADALAMLQHVFPSSRPTVEGIVFDLADARSCSEALAAIRRRVNVERLIPQFRATSP